MDMRGEYRIAAPRAKVWAALNDPAVLQAALPGCQSLEKISDTEYQATVVAKVGPVKAKFAGNVQLTDLTPLEGYTIAGEGKGGAAGFAKGRAEIKLAEDGDVTVLTYTAKAEVGGKLAQIGSRLIDGTAKKLADEFFAALAKQLAAPEPAPAPRPAAPPEPDRGLQDLIQNKLVWAGGAIVVLMILALLLR